MRLRNRKRGGLFARCCADPYEGKIAGIQWPYEII